jgi:ATP-dependent Clp protease ATP-binding subunit ClpC
VLVYAQDEARLLNHNFIGTEHILLGLLHEGEGVAATALEALDVHLEATRQKVAERIGPAGSSRITTGSIPFTPRSKKVLELSLRESMQLAHKYIGTEHILLGLVREGEGVAAQVLVSLGADLSAVRQQVLKLLEDPRGESTGELRMRAGQEPRPQAQPPFCPHCHSPLQGGLRYARLPASGAGPLDPAVDWTIIYCGSCGRALGTSAGGMHPGGAL